MRLLFLLYGNTCESRLWNSPCRETTHNSSPALWLSVVWDIWCQLCFWGTCDNILNFSFTSNMGTYCRVTKSQAEMIFALQSLLNPLDRNAMMLVRHRWHLFFTTHSLSQTMVWLVDGGRCTWGTRGPSSCALQWPSSADLSKTWKRKQNWKSQQQLGSKPRWFILLI